MKRKFLNPLKSLNPLLTISAVAMFVSPASAALLIYEPFDYTVGANGLNGADTSTSATGLTGSWSGGNADIVAGSNSWGSLATDGNRALMDSSGSASVGIGASTLTGRLGTGQTLWFSTLIVSPDDLGTNPDAGFSFGDAGISSTNNLPIGAGNQAFGFRMKSGQLRAAYWDGGTVQSSAGAAISTSTEYLVVGEIIFGEDGVSNDTINIYLPGTNLVQGDAVSTASADLSQASFGTIGWALKNPAQPATFDEIRFGTSYEEVVVPVPEPTAALLGSLGFLALLRRRR